MNEDDNDRQRNGDKAINDSEESSGRVRKGVEVLETTLRRSRELGATSEAHAAKDRPEKK